MTDQTKTAEPAVGPAKETKTGPFAPEIALLLDLEAALSKAHDAYEAGARKAGEDGHAPGRLAPVHVDLARRALGKAHGGVLTALHSLEEFGTRHAAAEIQVALEKRKKEQAK